LSETSISTKFNELYYEKKNQTWGNTTWMGVPVHKNPCDLWIYQEIISKNRPDFIIETGTFMGGSALYLANICDLVGRGEIITVDIRPRDNRPEHKRITYRTDSSISDDTIDTVKYCSHRGKTVMVILDSDHRKIHVMEELRLYSKIVTPGQYLIVEDTNINGHPSAPGWGPGPMEAVQEWLPKNKNFVCDESTNFRQIIVIPF
jgi:cephalosporin hydroxylase